VLVVRGLRKTFPPVRKGVPGTVALDAVDLDVSAGAFASVLGPSGSGKTTLLRCIAGFERPDAGTITVGDRTVASPAAFVRAHARGVGIVPQEGALFPHLSVAQNIGFGLASESRRARRQRVRELLELIGLEGFGDRRPDQLSGGQQQRVALARALAPNPQVVLLDEPFSALDAQLRAELREEVRETLRAVGSTAILVTHDQAEAMSLADHLIVMREGRVVAAGTPQVVYERPVDADLGRFLGEALVLPGRIVRGADSVRVECALGELAVGDWHGGEGTCTVLIRPEQIAMRCGSGDGEVSCTITSQSYFGHDAMLRVRVNGIAQPISVRVPGRQSYQVGSQACLDVVDPVRTYAPDA
jgi:iron(III) transport system ATP-binding protein